MFEAGEIFKSDWGSDQIEYSNFENWKFDNIKTAIDLKANGVLKDHVHLVAQSIKFGFTYRDYDDFTNNILIRDLNNYECATGIMESAFKTDLRLLVNKSPSEYARNEEIWTKEPKTFFLTQLKYLSQMFEKIENNVSKFNHFFAHLQNLFIGYYSILVYSLNTEEYLNTGNKVLVYYKIVQCASH